MNGTEITVVGLGEALYDVFPDRRVLGGAPLNVAVHAHAMLKQVGGRGIVASRIGNDQLGSQLLRELRGRGMTCDYLQIDEDRPTGCVNVTMAGGDHSFEIAEDSAWDMLSFDNRLGRLASSCHAACFGSLAQRNRVARATIGEFLTAAPQALRLFDLNLRQEYFDAATVTRSCAAASAIKLNEHELPIVSQLLGLDPGPEDDNAATSPEVDARCDRQAAAILEAFNLTFVALTRGARGTVLFTSDGRFEGTPVSYSAKPDADAVGAGDACSAGLLVGNVLGWDPEQILDLANHAGAFVASVGGATPSLPRQLLDSISKG